MAPMPEILLTWEYRVERHSVLDATVLNDWGQLGWEIVTAVMVGASWVVLFKRAIVETK